MSVAAAAVAISLLCSTPTGLLLERSHGVDWERQTLSGISDYLENIAESNKEFNDPLKKGSAFLRNATVQDIARNAWHQFNLSSAVYMPDDAIETIGKQVASQASDALNSVKGLSPEALEKELSNKDSEALRKLRMFLNEIPSAMKRIGPENWINRGLNWNWMFGTNADCPEGPFTNYYITGGDNSVLCYRVGHRFANGLKVYWNSYKWVKFGFGLSFPWDFDSTYTPTPPEPCDPNKQNWWIGIYPNWDWTAEKGVQYPKPMFKYNMRWYFDQPGGASRFGRGWVQYTKFSEQYNTQTYSQDSEISVSNGGWGLEHHGWDCSKNPNAGYCKLTYFWRTRGDEVGAVTGE